MIETNFKNTEIGLIPEDWEVKTWGEVLTTFSSGATPYRGNPSYYSGDAKWISSGELNYNVITDTIEHISTEAIKDTNLTIHKPGTFLMAITGLEAAGTRGRCAFVGVPSCTNQSCLAINSTDKMIVQYLFWFYLANSETLAFKYAQGTKQQSYTANIVKQLPIIVPPLPEQRRIAEVLSEADDLIKQWENVIAKKRDIKTGTMQILLTGKKRLNGFDKPWVEKKLGEVCNVVDGTHQTPNYTTSGYQFYSVENVSADNFSNTKFISEDEYNLLTQKNKIEYNDILMTRIGSIGVCKYIDWSPKAAFYVSLALLKLKDDNIDMRFLAYYSNTKAFKKSVEEHSLTFAIPQKINLGEISNIEIKFPPALSEQRAIAEILSDMDEEIKTLELKVEKMRNIKSGMMQQLLSGKIRLVGDEADNVRQFVTENFGPMPKAAEDEEKFGKK